MISFDQQLDPTDENLQELSATLPEDVTAQLAEEELVAPAEPVAGAIVQPVLLGTEDASAAPAKKGWWRR